MDIDFTLPGFETDPYQGTWCAVALGRVSLSRSRFFVESFSIVLIHLRSVGSHATFGSEIEVNCHRIGSN